MRKDRPAFSDISYVRKYGPHKEQVMFKNHKNRVKRKGRAGKRPVLRLTAGILAAALAIPVPAMAQDEVRPGVYAITSESGGETLSVARTEGSARISVLSGQEDDLVRITKEEDGGYRIEPLGEDTQANEDTMSRFGTRDTLWDIVREKDGKYRFIPAGEETAKDAGTPADPVLLQLRLWTLTPERVDLASDGITVDLGGKTFYYTGFPVRPDITVRHEGQALTEGQDYRLSFKDNKAVGTAQAIIEGIGDYTGKRTCTFAIEPAPITNTNGGLLEDYFEHDGLTHTPEAGLSYKGRFLKEGVDYELIREGGVEIGQSYITIRGIGSFSGEQTLSYTIGGVAHELTDGMTAEIITDPGEAYLSCETIEEGSAVKTSVKEDAEKTVFLFEKHGDSWSITHMGSGLCLTEGKDKKLTFDVWCGEPGQYWKADLRSNGRFRLTNAETGSVLTLNEANRFYIRTAKGPDASFHGRRFLQSLYNEDYYVMQESICGSGILFTYCGDDRYRLMTDDGLAMTVEEDGYIGFSEWKAEDSQMWRIREEDGIVTIQSLVGGYLTTPYAIDANKEGLNYTAAQFLDEVRSVYLMAHRNGYRYGDSQSAVPSEDGLISCDRLISRALYNLGYTDQKNGGEVTEGLTTYLPAHGFETITDVNEVQAGDIIHVSHLDGTAGHCFVVASYDPATGICTKYDMGSNDRIKAQQPFTAQLDEWSNYEFAAAYRNPYVSRDLEHLRVVEEEPGKAQTWTFSEGAF